MGERRSHLRVLVIIVMLALIAVACGGGGDDGGNADSGDGGPSGEPQKGGTLRYGVEAETSGLNPTTDRFAAASYLMGNAVFDRITYLNDKGEYQPYLAESVTPNDDLTAWTVKLRPGIEFHDGTPLTSEALKLTFDLAIADPIVGLAIRPLFRADNAVEIVDELSATYYMAEPNAHFPLYTSSQVGYIASPTWLRAAEANPDLNQQPGRHRTVQVQEPDPGLEHRVRAQRRLVERRGLPRRHRVRRADRRRPPRRPAHRRRPRRHAHERPRDGRSPAQRAGPQSHRGQQGRRGLRHDQHVGPLRSTTSACARRWPTPPRRRTTSR